MQDTIIDLIRHGEPEGGRRYRGHNVDDPLSELGWSQMRNAVADFSGWQHIVSSPLRRCAEFANELSVKHGIDMTIMENLKEIGFGRWEGKTREQIKQDNLQEYQDFYRDPVKCRPQGAEDLQHFIDRVAVVFNDVITQHTGKHCLIVAHAGVLRAMIATVLQLPPASLYQITIKNAGITRIKSTNARHTIEFINQSMSGVSAN